MDIVCAHLGLKTALVNVGVVPCVRLRNGHTTFMTIQVMSATGTVTQRVYDTGSQHQGLCLRAS